MIEANPDKFQVMFQPKKDLDTSFNLDVSGAILKREPCVKLLSAIIDNHMSFVNHTNLITSKAPRQLSVVCRLKTLPAAEATLPIVWSFVISSFNYCPIYGTAVVPRQH